MIKMQRFNDKNVRSVLSFSHLDDAQMKGVACIHFDSQPSCRKSKIRAATKMIKKQLRQIFQFLH